MKSKFLFAATVLAIVYSCSPKIVPAVSEPPPPPAPPKTLSAELAEGKTLYENNCAKCHRLYDRREFDAQQWRPILASMQPNAGITDEQREKIYNYLTMD